MLILDETRESEAENLALDELLLLEAESGIRTEETLRLWDAQRPLVVLGRSSKVEEETWKSIAQNANVPILRRCSGGATIFAAPGCMFYCVLLSLDKRPHLRMLDQAHQFVMQRILRAIQPLCATARLDGTCDVVVDGKKASGNSLRVQRKWLLYHGTLLLNMDLQLVGKFLKHPPREPDYRQGRGHDDFLCNLNIDRDALRKNLVATWEAKNSYGRIDEPALRKLVREKYACDDWNLQR